MALPYQDWPSDEHKRWITMGNTFGEHLKIYVNDYARDKIPSSASLEARDIAERAIRDTIYGMMMLLDGIPLLPVGDGIFVRYVLTARLQDEHGATVEAIELAPGGDGLCIPVAGRPQPGKLTGHRVKFQCGLTARHSRVVERA